ncbi:UNVERIFIED_CONTAM: hypothetical protein Slati_0004000 [Sesamum latifolium]|uniref:Uncharacterized protein n=1 Tax=Sesamum latifolium TaxID=2727402 RepID=A0AAW2Y5W0_9LAMI
MWVGFCYDLTVFLTKIEQLRVARGAFRRMPLFLVRCREKENPAQVDLNWQGLSRVIRGSVRNDEGLLAFGFLEGSRQAGYEDGGALVGVGAGERRPPVSGENHSPWRTGVERTIGGQHLEQSQERGENSTSPGCI